MTNGDEGCNGTALINLKKMALWSYLELGMKEKCGLMNAKLSKD